MIGLSLKLLALLAGALVVVTLAYIRLAPSDPKAWHLPVAALGPVTPGPCVDQITLVPQGARASCLLADTPQETLRKLEEIALTSPRTLHLAGSATEGRITWVARSFLMGYPDYVTAQTMATPAGTRLDILSRQRFGREDLGVNAARLTDWLSQL